MWNTIESQDDIMNLLRVSNSFHDSCITEMHYYSGAHLGSLGLVPVNSKRLLHVFFQGSFQSCKQIELLFIGLEKLSLLPIDENYTCEIFEATLEKNNGRMVWCDGKVDKLEDLEVYDGTIIVSKMIQWRVVE